MLICEWEQNVEKSQQVSLAIVEEEENALTAPDYALQIMSQKKFCTLLDFLNDTRLG